MGLFFKIARIIRAVFRTIFVIINNCYCIPTYTVWCITFQPIYFIKPAWYYRIEGILFDWLLTMVAIWSYSAGYRIVETGDNMEEIINSETLVLVNHQSTGDVPMLMHCFTSRRNLLKNLNWLMDAIFRYTNFGIVSTLHGDFFIQAGKKHRQASLRHLETYLQTKFLPRQRKWMVLFPEGGFLRKRKEASKRYAAKNNLPDLEHVTIPRMGAIQTIIETLRKADSNQNGSDGETGSPNRQLKYILDVTLAYRDGIPLGMDDIVTGYPLPCQVRMHYKIYPLTEVPQETPQEFQNWLVGLFIQKNAVLGNYYKTGIWDSDIEVDNESQDVRTGERSEISMATSVTSTEESFRRRMPHENDVISDSLTEDFGDHRSGKEDAGGKFKLQEERHVKLDLLRATILHFTFILSTSFHVFLVYLIYKAIALSV